MALARTDSAADVPVGADAQYTLRTWFDHSADLISVDERGAGDDHDLSRLAIGITTLTECVKSIQPLYIPSYRGGNLSSATIIQALFHEAVGARPPPNLQYRRRCGHAAMHGARGVARGKPVEIAYSLSDVTLMLWCFVTKLIDAEVHRLLGRGPQRKKARHRAIGVNDVPSQDWPTSLAQWLHTARFLQGAMSGTVGCLEPVSIDQCAEQITLWCASAFGASVDDASVRERLAPICAKLEPSVFLAATISRTSLTTDMIGETLATRLGSYVTSAMMDTREHHTDENVLDCIIAELCATRAELAKVRVAAANNDMHGVLDICGPGMVLTATPRHRTLKGCTTMDDKRNYWLRAKSAQLEYALATKIAFKHLPAAITLAHPLLSLLEFGVVARESAASIDSVVRGDYMADHAFFVDAAIDLMVTARIAEVRSVA